MRRLEFGGYAPVTVTTVTVNQMSEKFRETGSELYIGAGGREHD